MQKRREKLNKKDQNKKPNGLMILESDTSDLGEVFIYNIYYNIDNKNINIIR